MDFDLGKFEKNGLNWNMPHMDIRNVSGGKQRSEKTERWAATEEWGNSEKCRAKSIIYSMLHCSERGKTTTELPYQHGAIC